VANPRSKAPAVALPRIAPAAEASPPLRRATRTPQREDRKVAPPAAAAAGPGAPAGPAPVRARRVIAAEPPPVPVAAATPAPRQPDRPPARKVAAAIAGAAAGTVDTAPEPPMVKPARPSKPAAATP